MRNLTACDDGLVLVLVSGANARLSTVRYRRGVLSSLPSSVSDALRLLFACRSVATVTTQKQALEDENRALKNELCVSTHAVTCGCVSRFSPRRVACCADRRSRRRSCGWTPLPGMALRWLLLCGSLPSFIAVGVLWWCSEKSSSATRRIAELDVRACVSHSECIAQPSLPLTLSFLSVLQAMVKSAQEQCKRAETYVLRAVQS
jgi:hypothetical protein